MAASTFLNIADDEEFLKMWITNHLEITVTPSDSDL
jgi:hypothetical protein